MSSLLQYPEKVFIIQPILCEATVKSEHDEAVALIDSADAVYAARYTKKFVKSPGDLHRPRQTGRSKKQVSRIK